MSDDERSEFYKNLYEELYSQHGYHGSDELATTHYHSLLSVCLDPAGIEYETVLDIGCSTGLGIKYFFEPRGKICEGIDVSETAIKRAVARGVSAQVASMTSIPFDDNSFDLVCASDMIEHLRPEDQEQAWRECFRVSKKYVAHKIANTPEGNTFGGKTLHLTCWSRDRWMEWLDSLNLDDWKLIYELTPEVWDKIKCTAYAHFDPNQSGGANAPWSWEEYNHHNTVVVYEKK